MRKDIYGADRKQLLKRCDIRQFLACAAFGAGELLAAQGPQFASAWPVLTVIALVVLGFGFGLGMRGWRYLFLFVLGMALFLFASVESERDLRMRPWMRGQRASRYVAKKNVDSLANFVKSDFAKRLEIGLGHNRKVAALNRAILLGERGKLPWRIRQVFVESGTMHIFAISGLHVMAVTSVLMALFMVLLVPRRFVGAVTIPFVWGYVCLIDWSPSAVRAAMMASICLLAPLVWRRPHGITAWTVTFMMVHAACPQMIVNVGSALSFMVMLSIIVADVYFRDLPKFTRALAITVFAWMAGVPIAAHVFGRVTFGGILANLVLIGMAEATVITGMSGLLVSFVSKTIAAHLNNLSALFTDAMVGISEMVARLPGSNFDLQPWGYAECVEWYVMMVLVLYLVHSVKRRRRLL